MTTTSPPTTIGEAAPLSTTPSGLPDAPTGDYNIFLGGASEASNSCVSPSGRLAWSCTPGMGFSAMNLTVTNPMWDRATVQLSPSIMPPIILGALPPNVSASISAPLMNDTLDPELGPALFFHQVFDKIVIVPLSWLNSSTPSKRSPDPSEMSDLHERNSNKHMSPNVWVCYWNNTSLDGFIYVNSTSISISNETSLASSLASQPTPAPDPDMSNRKRHEWGKDNGRNKDDDGGYGGGGNHKDDDGGDGFNQNGHGHWHQHDDNNSTRHGWSNQGAIPFRPYPNRVKVQEYRDPAIASKTPPYCLSMQISNGFDLVPPPGGSQRLDLSESSITNSRFTLFGKRRIDAPNLDKRDGGTCYCEWLI
jgi:hypothetical protein